MSIRLIPVVLIAAGLVSCNVDPPQTNSGEPGPTRPLVVDRGGGSLAFTRADLIATAFDRFGAGAVRTALSAPTYLIAKRFTGMAPPPPPGAGPDWTPPTPAALLMKGRKGWIVATANGWRPANAAAAELDKILDDPRFWSEAAFVPPCPDCGASVLLLKVQRQPETTRKSTCTSIAEKAVFAALGA